MSSKLYYKHAAESDLGEGEVFLEAIDGIFTRQVEKLSGAISRGRAMIASCSRISRSIRMILEMKT